MQQPSVEQPIAPTSGAGDDKSKRAPWRRNATREQLVQLDQLEEYELNREKLRRGIPEHPSRRGQPWLDEISRRTGIPVGDLQGRRLRRQLDVAISRIGLQSETVDVSKSLDSVPLDTDVLTARMLEMQKSILRDLGKSEKQIYKDLANLKSAVKKAVHETGGDKPLDEAIRLAQSLTLEKNPADRKRIQQLRIALELINKISKSDFMPDSFSERLAYFIQITNVPCKALVRKIDIPETTLRSWAYGKKRPVFGDRDRVRKLEAALGAPPGSLLSVLKHSRLDKRKADEDGEQSAREGTFLDRTRATDEFPAQSKAPGTVLREELEQYVAFRTKFRGLTDDTPGPKVAVKASSAQGDVQRITNQLRYLANSQNGPRVDRDKISMAWLVFPMVMAACIEDTAERRSKKHGTGDRRPLAGTDLATMYSMRAMVEPDRGFLALWPELAEKLVPLRGLVSADEVSEAKRDWLGQCRRAHAEWAIKIARGRERKERLKPPFEGFLPIMMQSDPLAALDLVASGLNEELSVLDPGAARDVVLRDRVLIGLQSQLGFRAETLRKLETTDIKAENGQYVVRVSREKFKNKDGPYFRIADGKYNSHFQRRVNDNLDLFKFIGEYLGEARPRMLGGAKSELLFVGKDGSSRPLSETGISEPFRKATARYLQYRQAGNRAESSGIENVRAFGVQGFRAIVCCGVYRRSRGNRAQAARAIADSMKIAEQFYMVLDNSDDDQSVEALLATAAAIPTQAAGTGA